MDDKEFFFRKRCLQEPQFFFLNCLKIKTKDGGLQEFALNKAQKYIEQKLEEQKKATGKVRAYILKGRQQGASTYITARFYHKTTHSIGANSYILTHLQEATDNLFSMVQRYHESNPFKPHTGASNAKELVFDQLDSGYKVGTAGSKAVGRGATIQNFHGSEVAFYPNAKEHLAGVLQAVPDAPDTEIIFESTANGVGNPFYEGCISALSGASDYQLIFVPWYWQDEYVKLVTKDFQLHEDEHELTNTLSNEQILWRRKKIEELGDVALFKQEYPMNVLEAFQATSNLSLITADKVEACINYTSEAHISFPIQMALDVARHGDDESCIVVRQGRKVHKIERYRITNLVELAGKVVELIKEYKPIQLSIDTVGMGIGVLDILDGWGYGSILESIGAGNKAYNENKYMNVRAEMWDRMKQAIEDKIDLPKDERLRVDLCGLQYSYDARQRLKLERKEDMKKRGLASPDSGDALAMTYAVELNMTEPVAPIGFIHKNIENNQQQDDEYAAISDYF